MKKPNYVIGQKYINHVFGKHGFMFKTHRRQMGKTHVFPRGRGGKKRLRRKEIMGMTITGVMC